MSFILNLLRNFSRNWAHRPPKPEPAKMSERYRSKSAFKLFELNERYNFLRKGLRVLDLGCSPGGWTEVAVEAVSSSPSNPSVYSVDIISCLPYQGASFLIADVTDLESHTLILSHIKLPVDVIISDLSTDTHRDKDIDCISSCSLNFDVLRIANYCLKPGGTMLMKILAGASESTHFVMEYSGNSQRILSNSWKS